MMESEAVVTNQGNQAAIQNKPAEDIWRDHCQNAARKFLKNVVIIDNEPVITKSNPISEATVAAPATSSPEEQSLGEEQSLDHYNLKDNNIGLGPMGAASEVDQDPIASLAEEVISPAKTQQASQQEAAPEENEKEKVGNFNPHTLDIRTASDAFAEAGLACAFVLPELSTTEEEKIIKRSLSAAAIADIVILDWYLKGSSPSLTLQILERIAHSDCQTHGRLRLICIYTGQEVLHDILKDAATALTAGGISTVAVPNLPYAVRSDNCLLVVLNKRNIKVSELPHQVINAFSVLSDGLIPSFALAAVGAIRTNMHHMLTRFEVDLDPAYIGNRLITDPPEDVADLVRDLLVNECDNGLALDSIAEEFLAAAAIEKWLAARHKAPVLKANGAPAPQPDALPVLEKVIKGLSDDRAAAATLYGTEILTIQTVETQLREAVKALKQKSEDLKIRVTQLDHVNQGIIKDLLTYGINERGINAAPGAKARVEIAEKNRKHISAYLAGSADASKISENKFSRLVGLRKEAFGSHKTKWDRVYTPTLTTGTILSLEEIVETNRKRRHFLCLTPACDTLRLEGERAFSFIEAFESASAHNVVVKDEVGKDLFLRFDTKLPEICTFKFSPDSVRRRVISQPVAKAGRNLFEFTSNSGGKFIWLGELRYSRVVSEIGKITGTWMRIGVIDSEYLRIMGKS